ncbi:elongation of very long chain fatty acids protein 2-like [Eupeodes corollae]|uniref:elongation of very long chain fatty acids protein 2-like n=1 Tax=Eupeodes corollae TaxID=290404 RepID=UPI002493C38C|nr:elongation of very long chain fatty acids protein 2-like [Eupeodes corollae]XP_055919811.1 elongation of very long chain fatty acids protein 2-like [Eupeodes corollae]
MSVQVERDDVFVIPKEWIVSNTSAINVDTRIGVGKPVVAMILMYLLIIYKITPSFMKSRPAYQLKGFMILYNIYQIAACAYLITQIYLIDLPTLEYGACVDFEPGTQVEKDFNHISYFLVWLKASEMIETVVFVLRKKQNQVSFLHVFHHCTVLFLAYNLISTYRSSSALLPAFINSSVHIIMYSYYLMAAVLPSKIVVLLTPFKKAITTIQMVQFTIVLFHVVVLKIRGCEIPELMLAIYIIVIIVIFYGFYDFYKKSYTENNSKAKVKSKEEQRRR